jgi:hypothetical protein
MTRTATTLLFSALIAIVPAISSAQMRTLRIVSSDSAPIMYAFVSVEGGVGQISNENGEVKLGTGKRKTVTVNARRIGFQPFFGKIELPDTAAVITIVLPRITQQLGEVQVTARARVAPSLQSFYDRWLMRQKGVLSATFIGPEEIEFRHPDKITNMLDGLNGVSFRNTAQNQRVAFGYNNQCQMAILVDGIRQCPAAGCKCSTCGGNVPEISQKMMLNGNLPDSLKLTEMNSVPIDNILAANDVAAIEVYTRGGNMPVSLQVSDAGCGVIAFWTGSRRF